MDSKVLVDILKMVGLPGVVIVGWVMSALTGKGNHDNVVIWGGALASSVAINFLVFQLGTWRESIVSAVKEEINNTQLRNTEAMEVLASTQHQMVLSLANVMAAQDGGLTLVQIRALLGHLCEAFKWRTWQICLGSLDTAILKSVSREGLQAAVEVQITAILRQLAQYNDILSHNNVLGITSQSIAKIFDTLYDADLLQNDNFAYRVRTIVESIRREYDFCAIQIGEFIDQKKAELELTDK